MAVHILQSSHLPPLQLRSSQYFLSQQPQSDCSAHLLFISSADVKSHCPFAYVLFIEFYDFFEVCDVASSAYLPHSGKSRLGCEAGGFRLRTYRLLMSTQKQLLGIKKEPLIFINNQKPFSTYRSKNRTFVLRHLLCTFLFQSYFFHFFQSKLYVHCNIFITKFTIFYH